MAKSEIGFNHGAPENPDKTWRGFQSDRDLTPEEVEQLPQFADFVSDS